MRKIDVFLATTLAMAVAMPVTGFAQAQEPAADSQPAKPAPKAAHRSHGSEGKLAPTAAGDKATDNLNNASLDSAKTGKPFVAPTTPEAAKKSAHFGASKPRPASHKASHRGATDDAAAPAPAPQPVGASHRG